MSKTKYRPSITASQIRKLIHLARNEAPITDESIQIISVLSPFLAKIECGANKPAYSTAPKKAEANSLVALGGAEDIATNVIRELSIDKNLPKTVLWEQCYIKYSSNPDSCSAHEIACSQEHRYLNDLMTPEEIAAFELQQFKNYNQ